MKCAQCQPDNPPHARFCLGGGAHLTLARGSCGTQLPGGARFCLQCGQAVAAGRAAWVRSPARQTYIPRHLAEKRRMLEEERRDLEEIATRFGFGSPDNTMRGTFQRHLRMSPPRWAASSSPPTATHDS